MKAVRTERKHMQDRPFRITYVKLNDKIDLWPTLKSWAAYDLRYEMPRRIRFAFAYSRYVAKYRQLPNLSA